MARPELLRLKRRRVPVYGSPVVAESKFTIGAKEPDRKRENVWLSKLRKAYEKSLATYGLYCFALVRGQLRQLRWSSRSGKSRESFGEVNI